MERYALRPDDHGFTILDLLTGKPAVLATLSQTGLSRDDAEHTLGLFKARKAVMDWAAREAR
ncbi:MAG: hypothetical protein Q8Q88_12295 [Phenylobacterium sp.]|uniref:hypothetical protein n=1 Tax=Phenylobacterium sp. TaxID=1871053 RepID=UPI0027359116|nr:hypothetical protein [Phenylobacterium sp.]MDP3747816.1 hypothetical protein [Phenylobacterium sp.]